MKKLVALACVQAIILAVLLFALRGCDGEKRPPKTTTTEPTTTTTTTATTTKPTIVTKTTAAGSTGEILVNMPIVDTMAKDALQQLTELCRRSNGAVSFYYIDLESGYELEYRADRAYQAASVIKAPYVKYLLSTGVDGSEKLTMLSSDKQGGSGVVDKQPAGTQFTVDELMENAVRHSDNTAYYMLNKRFGFQGFNAYASALGITANANSNCVLTYPRPRFGYLSARDIGLYMADIAKYIEQGSADAKRLKQWMMSTSEERQLTDAFSSSNVLYGKTDVPSETVGSADTVNFHYDVAHKYGDTLNIENAFHDGAIVYAEQPFVLAVATSLEPFATSSIETFHELAFQINKIHCAYHKE